MCGRLFTDITPISDLYALLDALNHLDMEIPKRNNIAPTDPLTVVYHDGIKYTSRDMRWWLHASWQKEPPNQTHSSFNARIETLLSSSLFKIPTRQQRGLVIVDGFVEFKKIDDSNVKQPYFVQGKNQPLVLAAIWDVWNQDVYSCAIVMQDANENFSEIHDRMPLSFTTEQALRWINPREKAEDLLQDLKGASIELWPRKVSTSINNARVKVEAEFI